MGVTSVTRTRNLNSVQACSDLHVALALVGVRRVTVLSTLSTLAMKMLLSLKTLT